MSQTYDEPSALDAAIESIRRLDTHDDLRLVNDAINRRFKQLRAQEAVQSLAALSVGAKVRLGRIKPKYLAGQTGIVTEYTTSRVTVKLDNTFGINPRYLSREGTIQVSPGCAEVIA